MSKWVRNALIISAAVVLAAASFIAICVYNRHRVQSFINEFRSLRLGTTTFSDAQRFASQYGGSAWDLKSEACSNQRCHLKVVFYNTVLNYIQGRRQVSLAAGLTVENGYVVSREIDYSILARTWNWDSQYMYVVHESLGPRAASTIEVKTSKIDSEGKPHWVEVSLDEDTRKELRERAYALDLACVIRPYDCNSVSDVVPSDLLQTLLGGQARSGALASLGCE